MQPRRGAIALTITTLALSLLFSFRAGDTAAATGSGSNGNVLAVAQATAAATATATATAAATAAPSPAPASNLADGTYIGSGFSTRWGDVQVTVTISGGTITDVSALSYPANDNHSAQLNARAVPTLRTEVLAAQGARIDTVSGATYTSKAYIASVQSALDQARAA